MKGITPDLAEIKEVKDIASAAETTNRLLGQLKQGVEVSSGSLNAAFAKMASVLKTACGVLQTEDKNEQRCASTRDQKFELHHKLQTIVHHCGQMNSSQVQPAKAAVDLHKDTPVIMSTSTFRSG